MYLKYFGQNTCCIFYILTTKYNTSGHALPKLGLCNAKSQCHREYKVRYCTKRFSAVDIVPWGGKLESWIFIRQLLDGKMTSYYSVSRTNKASNLSPPLMNALNLLFEEYFAKLF